MKRLVWFFVAVVYGAFSGLAWGGEAAEIVRGPVLGSPSPTSIAVWLQASVPRTVRVTAVDVDSADAEIQSPWVVLEPEARLMATVVIEGLEPGRSYRYQVETADGTIWEHEEAIFRTPPEVGAPTRVTMAAGSGANHWARFKTGVWSAIADSDPDLFLALGDTPYADGLLWVEDDFWEEARDRYEASPSEEDRRLLDDLGDQYRRRAPEAMALSYESFRETKKFNRMARKIFWVATWDDHETGMDNGDRDNPVLAQAREAFKAFTPNPSFGADGEGVYWAQQWGDVDIILLDDQTWRTPTTAALAEPESATMLGNRQFDWLVDRLAGSKAVFKIVVNGSPFNDFSRKEDAWVGYPAERERLMDAIARNRVGGVVLLSGDVHRSEFFRLPWLEDRGGYPLFELVTSPLFQRSRGCGESVPDREFCYGDPEKSILELFAWIEADTTLGDPLLTLQVRDHRGEVMLDRHLRASELQWPAMPEEKAGAGR
ncbi:MAG: alkaline phosphatase D family protein [Acidobacteriota bacterium]